MKKFFLGLVTSESGTSSKRFMSLLSFALLVVIIVADVWFTKEVNDIVYYTLGGIILGTSSMTLVQGRNRHHNDYMEDPTYTEYNNEIKNQGELQ